MTGARHRPPGVTDETVEAVGKATEALEYIIRARGHLYSMHQLIGRADFLLDDAATLLDEADCRAHARELRDEIVGRNVLDGRWTFQIVEEFDDLYYRCVEAAVHKLVDDLMDGRAHLFESEMKEKRRTAGHFGHEARPLAAHSPLVEIESS
jgi:hypothetical protein